MKAIDRLSVHLKNRLVDLQRKKEDGHKIVGYLPGGYLPEELVLASGAIPLCLVRGGDHSMVELAAAYICRWIDTFCRAQIGYGVSGDDPYYTIIDLLAVPITDNHIRAVSDVLDYNTTIEIFPFGVPHMKEEATLDYYRYGITTLKAKLEEVTGSEIADEKLHEAIILCNQEKRLLREISLMTTSRSVPIRCQDFVSLCHSSSLADKRFLVDVLTLLCEELKGKKIIPLTGPRILLTGSTLAMGDYRIINLIEDAGGVVVIAQGRFS